MFHTTESSVWQDHTLSSSVLIFHLFESRFAAPLLCGILIWYRTLSAERDCVFSAFHGPARCLHTCEATDRLLSEDMGIWSHYAGMTAACPEVSELHASVEPWNAWPSLRGASANRRLVSDVKTALLYLSYDSLQKENQSSASIPHSEYTVLIIKLLIIKKQNNKILLNTY